MQVCRFNKPVLVFFSVILLIFLFVTYSITQKDNLGDFNGKKWREQSVLLDTQTSIGNPHGARSLKETDKSVKVSSTTCAPGKTAIDVAAVVCGDRSKEIMNMVKSVLIFTNHQVHFHIVSERDLQEGIKRSFDKFPSNVKEHFGFTLYNLSYPPGENIATWKNLFKTCASQRLFLMDFIKRDKVLYLDTDTLLLSPVEKIWHHFSKFNKTQLAAMTREGELASLNWYHRFARHPFYGKLGLNSGVMLMDLRKLRDLKFTQNIIEIYREHKYNIVWGDQDLLNIYFNKHPDRVYLYPCEWNYRPDHCMYQNNCQSVLRNGVYVLHGNRGVFHNDKQKAFRTVYDAIKKYKFGGNVETDIVAKILNMESLNSDRYCKLMAKSFVKNMLQPNG